MKKMVQLHVHTAKGSLLDSIIRVNELVDKTIEYGGSAVAVTDHGSMSSIIDLYKACKGKEIKPIIGVEVYMTDDYTVKDTTSKYNHLILLAKNNDGYNNLKTLSSIGYIDGFYSKPRIDFETLSKHHDGLICLSACIAGSVPQLILNGGDVDSEILKFKTLFDSDYYLEVQAHTDETQIIINKAIIELANKHHVKVVATTDAHFLNKEDFDAHNIFININQDRDTENYKDCYIQPYDTMVEHLMLSMSEQDAKTALNNTLEIEDKCNVEIEIGVPYLPHLKDANSSEDEYRLMVELVKEGMRKKNILSLPNKQEYIDRVKMELEVIKFKGYQGYFDILIDLLNEGKKHNIPFGACRGSSGGSIVAYFMGITDIDSIKYDLDFGRFLTKERTELPDIDTDVSTKRRGEFIQLITEKHGFENVSQIGAFGTLASKAVIDAVGKVMDIDKETMSILKKKIGENKVPKIKEIDSKFYNENKEFIDMCIKLEGLPRSFSAHAGGVCISGDNKPVTAFAPVRYNKDNRVTTQLEMHDVESVGLVKYDMLGLVTLDIIADCLEDIGSGYYDYEFDYDDLKVYDMVSDGNTNAVFQAESNFMTRVFKEVKPRNIFEWSDCIAIGRPDSIKFLEPYVNGKFNGILPEEIHPDLTKILSKTYGCLIYQEQIMNITKVFGKFSDGEADKFRKMVSKKDMELKLPLLEKFRERTIANGYSEEVTDKLVKLLDENANYCFNMAHSISYAITGYKTAYLKFYYPLQFMASVLNNQRDENTGAIDYEGVAKYIKECNEMKIDVTLPDINSTSNKFTANLKDNTIMYGFDLIKGLGSNSIEIIFTDRVFDTIKDFMERTSMKLDKTSVISLIKSGSFDIVTDLSRASILKLYFLYRFDNKKELLKPIGRVNKNHINELLELGLISPEQQEDKEFCTTVLNKYRKSKGWVDFQDTYMQGTELDWEMETLQSFMSGDPFEGVELPDWENVLDTEYGWVGGTITNVTKTKVKNGKSKGQNMAFINIDTAYGIIDCVIFADKWLKYQDILKFGKNVVVMGEKSGDLNMKLTQAQTLEQYLIKMNGVK